MAESVDVLIARWRKNGDVQSTVAACDGAVREPREGLPGELSAFVKERFSAHAGALVSAGRMQLALGTLDDAQDLFVRAGKVSPKDGDVYRFLGETLLRKGDAERAEKVLERAIAFGAKDPDVVMWLDRAHASIAAQKEGGPDSFAKVPMGPNVSPNVAPPKPPTQKLGPPPIMGSAASPGLSPRPPPVWGQENAALGRGESRPIDALTAALNSEMPTVAAGMPVTPHPAQAVYAIAQAQQNAPPSSRNGNGDGRDIPIWQPPPPNAPAGMIGAMSPQGSSVGSAYRGELPRLPDPRDVLDALSLAGIYEKDEAAKMPLVWDQAAAGPRRRLSYATLITGIILSTAAVCGIFFFVQARRRREHLEAEVILTRVDADLRAADGRKFPDTEKAIGDAFELDSRSTHAALDWTRERAIKGLVLGPGDIAFEDAVARAKEVGVPDGDLVFAAEASFLFQGDTAGAAAVLQKSDTIAGKDPYYELISGAVFERAGDSRSLERYGAALTLDPQLFAAAVALTRVTAIEGDPKRAFAMATELRGKYPDRPEPIVLVALSWAKDPREKAPLEVAQAQELKDLPISLKAVPRAVTAIVKAQAGNNDEARAALKESLALTDGPGVATWIGSVALDVGDEELARRAALVAVSYSAVYPPARMLAARVALTAGRYDEALKAAEDLETTATDVSIVRAAASYEKLDVDGVAKANDALTKDARVNPVVLGIQSMPNAIFLRNLPPSAKLLEAAASGAPWADIVAMDESLLAGDIDTADKIAAIWKTQPQEVARTLRLATLARYKGNLEDADKFSAVAISAAPTMRAIVERAMVLVTLKKKDEVDKLVKAYPTALGPLGKWLSAYVLASFGKTDEARERTATDDPPPPEATAFARVLAGNAFGAMKDARRGQPYLKRIVSDGIASPDIANAADAVHLPKVTPAKR